jgi:hypothetical protein
MPSVSIAGAVADKRSTSNWLAVLLRKMMAERANAIEAAGPKPGRA